MITFSKYFWDNIVTYARGGFFGLCALEKALTRFDFLLDTSSKLALLDQIMLGQSPVSHNGQPDASREIHEEGNSLPLGCIPPSPTTG